MIIASNWSGCLSAYSGRTHKLVKSNTGVGEQIREEVASIAFSDHHSCIATGTTKGIIQIWDLSVFKLIAVALQDVGLI